MMNLYNYIWILIQALVGYNLVLPILLYIFFKLKRKNSVPIVANGVEADYAIIVTAYQQTDLLPVVVNSLLQLNYNNFVIYVVADHCDVSGLNFNDDRVLLLSPKQVLASNTKSHFYAIDHFIRPHERLTIIDSDNLVDPEYLNQLNIYFDQGFHAVQGVRKAKNLDTDYACLDAARDIYYHFYDGKILFELNSSATLSGSGMAFTTDLYIECLKELKVEGAGFDKVLQAQIVGKNYRIAFTEKAIVYDEKTSMPSQLVKQRARWINTWLKYFKFGFQIIGKGIGNASIHQFLFGLVLLRPPLFMFILASGVFMLINLFTSTAGVVLWLIAFLLFVYGFYISLSQAHASPKIYASLKGIPKFIFFQLISLLKSKHANKTSVATTHYHRSNDNLDV